MARFNVRDIIEITAAIGVRPDPLPDRTDENEHRAIGAARRLRFLAGQAFDAAVKFEGERHKIDTDDRLSKKGRQQKLNMLARKALAESINTEDMAAAIKQAKARRAELTPNFRYAAPLPLLDKGNLSQTDLCIALVDSMATEMRASRIVDRLERDFPGDAKGAVALVEKLVPEGLGRLPPPPVDPEVLRAVLRSPRGMPWDLDDAQRAALERRYLEVAHPEQAEMREQLDDALDDAERTLRIAGRHVAADVIDENGQPVEWDSEPAPAPADEMAATLASVGAQIDSWFGKKPGIDFGAVTRETAARINPDNVLPPPSFGVPSEEYAADEAVRQADRRAAAKAAAKRQAQRAEATTG